MIPVPMITVLYNSPNAYNEVLSYGLYHSAQKQKENFDGALKQVIYNWYKHKDRLTLSLRERLQSMIDEGVWGEDEDYQGFVGCNNDTFNPEYEMSDLQEYCKEDIDFREEIIVWYNLKQFLEAAGFGAEKLGVAITNVIKDAKKYDDFDGQPYAMVSPNLLLDYMNKHPKEKDRVRLAMVLAIQSIIGDKKVAATNKNLIVARMMGCKSSRDLETTIGGNEKLKEIFDIYTTRKKFDGLRDELLGYGFLKCWYPRAGSVYVSIQYEFKDVVDEIAILIFKKSKRKKERAENDRLLKEHFTLLNKGTP